MVPLKVEAAKCLGPIAVFGPGRAAIGRVSAGLLVLVPVVLAAAAQPAKDAVVVVPVPLGAAVGPATIPQVVTARPAVLRTVDTWTARDAVALVLRTTRLAAARLGPETPCLAVPTSPFLVVPTPAAAGVDVLAAVLAAAVPSPVALSTAAVPPVANGVASPFLAQVVPTASP